MTASGFGYLALQQFVEVSNLNFFTQQMLYQTPTLLAALVGVILSLINLKRYRVPAFLALLGSGTVIISSLIVTIAQGYFLSARFSSLAMTSQTYVQLANVIGWIGAFVKGLAIALLIVAIFIGRKGTTPASV
jgi:hypothetical protein